MMRSASERLSRVCANTHNFHTKEVSSSAPPTQTHILPTTPHPNAITPQRIFIRTTGEKRSPLARTTDAALICLVAQVVVTWLVPFILLFFLTTSFVSYRLSWSTKSLVFRSTTLDGYFRIFSALATTKLGHSTSFLSSFPFFLKPGLFPSTHTNSTHSSLISIRVWSLSDSLI